MNNRASILIVEDEPAIRNFMCTILESNNYRTVAAGNAKEALTLVASYCPDLVLLDLGLPDMDGLEVLRGLREWTALPVIIVSARGYEQDKVEALDAGADDYITKPFGSAELLARIRTALRHSVKHSAEGSGPGKYTNGGLALDFDRRTASVDGTDVHLTQIEYKIVALLAQNAGRVLTYESIIQQVWGPDADRDNQILRVNLANIRRKIEKNPAEPRYILTEVGVGYRMTDPE